MGAIGTVSNITKYSEEIETLINGNIPPVIVTTDDTVEDPSTFALEKHLEEFLIQNWQHTELGEKYDIYEIDGELVGQQFPSDTGPIDILAISKDRSVLLVVEKKKVEQVIQLQVRFKDIWAIFSKNLLKKISK